MTAASRAAWIATGADQLCKAGIESPRLEARLLLAHALAITADALLRDPAAPVPQAAGAAFQAMLDRRAAHAPLAFILGHREFWSLDLSVSPATLIPRPDSETLVEAACAAFAARPPPRRILDLGTGTGCLLLAVLSEFPAAFGVGVDRSFAAARLAAGNAAALRLADRAVFLCGDWATALDARFELILCNPPYIPTSSISELMPEVAEHEPRSALDGGADGLDAYRRIIPQLRQHLAPDGAAVFELGQGQAADVTAIAVAAGFGAEPRRDLAGFRRALILRAVP